MWIQTKNKLNQINSSLSSSILNNMNTCENQLLENDIFIAGYFIFKYYILYVLFVVIF